MKIPNRLLQRLALTAIPLLTAAVCWTAIGSPSLAEAASKAAMPMQELPNPQTAKDRDLIGVIMAYAPDTVPVSAPYYYVDGDTFDLVARPKKRWEIPIRVRVKNVNTPETRGYKCGREKELAKQAKEFVQATLSKQGALIQITDLEGFDDYGRYLAKVEVDGKDLGKLLVDAGLGRLWTEHYEGQTKDYWCQPTTAKRK